MQPLFPPQADKEEEGEGEGEGAKPWSRLHMAREAEEEEDGGDKSREDR